MPVDVITIIGTQDIESREVDKKDQLLNQPSGPLGPRLTRSYTNIENQHNIILQSYTPNYKYCSLKRYQGIPSVKRKGHTLSLPIPNLRYSPKFDALFSLI